MNSWLTLIAAVASFAIAAGLGKWLVPYLKKLKCGQTIRDEGPKWHQGKSGTPTMGGLMFIISSIVVSVILSIIYISALSVQENAVAGQNICKFFAGIVM